MGKVVSLKRKNAKKPGEELGQRAHGCWVIQVGGEEGLLLKP